MATPIIIERWLDSHELLVNDLVKEVAPNTRGGKLYYIISDLQLGMSEIDVKLLIGDKPPLPVIILLQQATTPIQVTTGGIPTIIKGIVSGTTDYVPPYAGPLQICGGDGDDNELCGGAGDDVLRGRTGDDVLYGMAGNDILYGEDGHDVLYGGTKDDELYGGDGNDWICGWTGDDELYGGGGNDVYCFTPNNGHDVVHLWSSEPYEGVNLIQFASPTSYFIGPWDKKTESIRIYVLSTTVDSDKPTLIHDSKNIIHIIGLSDKYSSIMSNKILYLQNGHGNFWQLVVPYTVYYRLVDEKEDTSRHFKTWLPDDVRDIYLPNTCRLTGLEGPDGFVDIATLKQKSFDDPQRKITTTLLSK